MGDSSAAVRMKQGAVELEVDAGGVITVLSGGVIDLRTGAIVKANGTQVSAIGALTNSTGVSPTTTIADVGGGFNQATLNQNFSNLTKKVNDIAAALASLGITA